MAILWEGFSFVLDVLMQRCTEVLCEEEVLVHLINTIILRGTPRA